ncbi:MAG: hypothetical protein WDN44_14050 [Sphingomonas sp.]
MPSTKPPISRSISRAPTRTTAPPEAFRPDPSAPVPASEREGLRPASGPAPTLVAGA